MKNTTDEVKFLADIESQIVLLQTEEQAMYKANRKPPQFLHKAMAELYSRAHKMREAQQQVTLPMSFDHLKAVFKADKDMQGLAYDALEQASKDFSKDAA